MKNTYLKCNNVNNYNYLLEQNKAENPEKMKQAKGEDTIRNKFNDIRHYEKCNEKIGDPSYEDENLYYEVNFEGSKSLSECTGEYCYESEDKNRNPAVNIFKVDKDGLNIVNSIDFSINYKDIFRPVDIKEVKIFNDKLIVSLDYHVGTEEYGNGHGFAYIGETEIFIYDIHDKENPKKLKVLRQDGDLINTIYDKDKIYVISSTVDKKVSRFFTDDVDLKADYEKINYKDNKLYIFNGYGPNTNIYKINIKRGILSDFVSIIIKGKCIRNDSMQLSKGNFILATLSLNDKKYNTNIFVLDNDLNIALKKEDKTLEEPVNAAFIKNKLFLFGKKTYEVNLSNKVKIKQVKSTIKFSNYMNYLDDNHILQIHKDNGALEINIYDVTNDDYKVTSSLKLDKYVDCAIKADNHINCVFGGSNYCSFYKQPINYNKKLISIPCITNSQNVYYLLLSYDNYDLKLISEEYLDVNDENYYGYYNSFLVDNNWAYWNYDSLIVSMEAIFCFQYLSKTDH